MDINELLRHSAAPWVLGGAIAFSVFLFIYYFTASAQEIIQESETVNAERQGILLYISPILRRLSLFTSMVRFKGINSYRRNLPALMIQGGMEGFMVAEEFVAFHVLAGLAPIPVIAYLCFIVGWGPGTGIVTCLPISLLAAFYPLYYLKRRKWERHKQIFRELPNVLDLLTVSVEAGLDFMGGMKLVCEKGNEGPLKDELLRTMKQLQLGVSRVDGLREMSERCKQPNLSSVVAALIQATKLGSSLGPILRIQASTLRERRSQIAEELANKAPVKIIFPIVAFIFPSVFLVLLGPVLIKTWYTTPL